MSGGNFHNAPSFATGAECAAEQTRPTGRTRVNALLACWLRPRFANAVVPALVLTALAGAPAGHAAELSLYEQRIAYQRAVHAIRMGRSGEFRREQAKLKDYALRPYLVYHDAQRRISSLSPKRARDVRAELADTPLAPIFHRNWLTAQVRRGRWDVYLANYEPSDDAAAQCNYLRALYRSGERTEALDQVRDLWVAPRSQPKTCDPLFEVWIASGRLRQESVWARLALALDAREVTLARYLLRFFDAREAAAGRLYYDVHVRPRTVRSLSRFKDDEGGRRALRHGLLRYARDDAEGALALWGEVGRKRAFGDADRDYIEERLTAAVAEASGKAPKTPPPDFSPDSVERIAQALVWHQRWAAAASWIQALPAAVVGKPRWGYWLGRALVETGDAQAGREQLETVAGLRTYYGFLAAEEIGRAPALNAIEPRHDETAREALLAVAAVRRMTELYAVGDLVNARREWRHALPSLDEAGRRHLVELTAHIGWGTQAIFGARDGEMADLIAIRFPTPHKDIFRRNAFQSQLPVQFLYAIARQESAFNARAVSSAGARGLMQLMPATARIIADRVRAKRPSREELFDPAVNARLAAHHLARLMRRYRGNRALVAAAYNAGERRVDRWLKDAAGWPTAVWVERIPFRETRDYVKGVIAFAHVYARLAGTQPPVLAAHERTITPP